jgi:hypothetical protein
MEIVRRVDMRKYAQSGTMRAPYDTRYKRRIETLGAEKVRIVATARSLTAIEWEAGRNGLDDLKSR